jgi:LacI family transcriptional regulator
VERQPLTSSRRVTLNVADQAGVSIATASRVLSGLVASDEAAERVRSAVEQLGYIPNEAARSLRSERTMAVGVAFDRLRLPGSLEMLDTLSGVLDEHGYTVLIAHAAGRGARLDVILRRFLERRVDALVCVNPHDVGPVLDRYVEGGIPTIVLISRGSGAARLPLIAPSLEPAASQAVERLKALGHSRLVVAIPGGEEGAFRAIRRRVRKAEIEAISLNPFGKNFSVGDVIAEVRGGSRATGVLATYPVALQLLAACREAGLRVPADLSIAAVSDEPALSNLLSPPLSAINVDLRALGEAAANAILDWIAGDEPQRNTLVATAEWVERATTGPARGYRVADWPTRKPT